MLFPKQGLKKSTKYREGAINYPLREKIIEL